jgi:RNA-directed DNA polymerase
METLTPAVKVESELFYKEWDLKQKNGKIRRITAPSPELNKIQHDVLYYLYGTGIGEGPYAEGFIKTTRDVDGQIVKQKNIYTNALKHCGYQCVLNIDIKDFFDSCDIRKIEWACSREGLNDDQMEVILKHCTYKDKLPTGACTSPFLSNVIGKHLLDYRMAALGLKREAQYSRYVDDLTWSSNNDLRNMIPTVLNIIKDAGLRANPKKVKVMYPKSRMMVTGLVVNPIHGKPQEETKPRIKRRRRYNFRALLHNANMSIRDGNAPTINYRKCQGFISFMNMVDPVQARIWRRELDTIKTMDKLIRRQ